MRHCPVLFLCASRSSLSLGSSPGTRDFRVKWMSLPHKKKILSAPSTQTTDNLSRVSFPWRGTLRAGVRLDLLAMYKSAFPPLSFFFILSFTLHSAFPPAQLSPYPSNNFYHACRSALLRFSIHLLRCQSRSRSCSGTRTSSWHFSSTMRQRGLWMSFRLCLCLRRPMC